MRGRSTGAVEKPTDNRLVLGQSARRWLQRIPYTLPRWGLRLQRVNRRHGLLTWVYRYFDWHGTPT
jgi:hypothetical protein